MFHVIYFKECLIIESVTISIDHIIFKPILFRRSNSSNKTLYIHRIRKSNQAYFCHRILSIVFVPTQFYSLFVFLGITGASRTKQISSRSGDSQNYGRKGATKSVDNPLCFTVRVTNWILICFTKSRSLSLNTYYTARQILRAPM